MADSQPAPRRGRRLTRRKEPADLARDLLRTEWAQNREYARQSQGPDGWQRLWRSLRRFLRRFSSEPESGYGQGHQTFDSGYIPGQPGFPGGRAQQGFPSGYGQGQQGFDSGYGEESYGQGGSRPTPQASRQPVSGPGQDSARLMWLNSEIQARLRLSVTEHKAFEKALLKLVSSGKWQRRLESLPLAAEYVRLARRAIDQEKRQRDARTSGDTPRPESSRSAASRIGSADGNSIYGGQKFTAAEAGEAGEARSLATADDSETERLTTGSPKSPVAESLPPAGQRNVDLLSSPPPPSVVWPALTPGPRTTEHVPGSTAVPAEPAVPALDALTVLAPTPVRAFTSPAPLLQQNGLDPAGLQHAARAMSPISTPPPGAGDERAVSPVSPVIPQPKPLLSVEGQQSVREAAMLFGPRPSGTDADPAHSSVPSSGRRSRQARSRSR